MCSLSGFATEGGFSMKKTAQSIKGKTFSKNSKKKGGVYDKKNV